MSRALIYERFGKPWEVLKFGYVQNDLLGGSSSSVKVKFLGSPVNPSDLNQIEGNYALKPTGFPAVGGNEGVARVEEVGQKVESVKPGDLVLPSKPGLGTWREFGVFKDTDLKKIPQWIVEKVPIEVLATLNVNPPTAFRLLHDFVELKPGDRVIQNGANSAVGRLVIQMASLMKVKTINVIRGGDRDRKDELAEELAALDESGGAQVILAEDLKALNENSAKLGLNCVGGGAVGEMSRFIEKDGLIVTYGGMSRRPVTVPTSALIFKNITLKGFWLSGTGRARDEDERVMMEIMNLYAEGKLKAGKSFWMDLNARNEGEFKDYIEMLLNDRSRNEGKCILRFK